MRVCESAGGFGRGGADEADGSNGVLKSCAEQNGNANIQPGFFARLCARPLVAATRRTA